MKNFLSLFLSICVASCVGTVDDKNLDTTKTAISTEKKLDFNGIVDAQAISDSRVAVFFNAVAGDPADFSYQIVVNNSQNPINVRGDSLEVNSAGQYTYIVTDLSPATKYAFNVNVSGADGSSGEGSLNIYATTFSNKTCDFEGVSSVDVPAGSGGKTSLVVRWVPAVTRSTSVVYKNIQDPYKYVIYKIDAYGGSGNLFNDSYNSPDKEVVEIPAGGTTEYRFPGLDSGKKYYFGVRCLHEGYKSNPSLLVEKNLKIISQTTRDNTAIFDWQPTSVNIITPSGKNGEKSRIFTWESAAGDFFNYRLYYQGYTTDPSLVPDPFTDVTLADPESKIYRTINAEDVSYELNLTDGDKYKYYHMKLIACATSQCLSGQRIGIDSTYLITKQIIPKIAPFQGIQKIENPKSATAVDSIWIKAEAPAMTEGHAHRLNLYCLKDGADKSTRFLKRADGTFGTGADDRGSCADLTVAGTVPATEAQLYAFTELEISGAKTDGTTYCLMMVPVLENITPAYYYEDIGGASIRCITPEIVTPKIYEFAGKDSCSLIGSSSSQLDVNWSQPGGGIYSGYYVYYKDEEVGTKFNFAAALQAQEDVDDSEYFTPVDIANRTTYTSRLSNLIPGHSYEIGVLTYVDVGGVKKFSEGNLNTYSCTVPIPEYSFQEWTGVMALGPKTNELYPKNMNAYFVQESLDAMNRPFEVLMKEIGTPADFDEEAADSTPTFGLDNEYVKTDLYGSASEFNGTYGSTTNSEFMSTALKYSNTGVIKFAFKDVLINIDGTSVNLSDYAINTIGLPAAKKDRKYGYKILRSEDNGTSWVDITKGNFAYQNATNEGLVVASNIPKVRPHAGEDLPAGNEWIINFTDYSVKAEKLSSTYTERARIYQYKVVPIFDGKELTMVSSSNNPTHNIIKITLPPPNMALVHRWMANRTWCREIGRNPNTAEGVNYSCSYSGLGSQGVTLPWRLGQTVIDLGGDLLVDRFELGCGFSRGDTTQDQSLNKSSFSGSQLDFEGLNDLTSPSEFKGCYYDEGSAASDNNLASQFSRENGGQTGSRYSQMVRGDCLGDGKNLVIPREYCDSPIKSFDENVYYPGNVNTPGSCSTVTHAGDGGTTAYNYEENSVQSLFASVFYQRSKYSSRHYGLVNPHYTAPDSARLTINGDGFMNNCMINLPYINGSGKYRPRWFGTSALMSGVRNSITAVNSILYNKTVGEVLANTNLYNLSDVAAPSLPEGMNSDTPMGRVFSSNGSGLPPLDGMDQEDTHNLCSTFNVEVGIKVGSDPFASFGQKKPKRLLRRKEFIASSAWSESLAARNTASPYNDASNDGTILQIEAEECNSNYKGVDAVSGGADYNQIGEDIRSNFGFVGATSTRVPLLTGSGVSTGVNSSSAKCVSKYGIQDLVGNVVESVSDQLFCFTGERIMFNKTSAGLGSGDAEWTEYPGSSFIEENEFNSLFQTPFLDTINTGRCSVNEEGASRAYDALIPGSSIINSIFTEIGSTTVNPLVVPKVKNFDIESLNQARNGDGSFLDFGNDRLGPNLSNSNNLSSGGYFSHLLGLPLSCSGTACNDSLDNEVINIDAAFDTSGRTLSSVNDVSFADGMIYKFSLGNSRFTNSGTLDVSVETRTFDPATMEDNQSFNYITDLDYSGGTWTATTADAKDNGGVVVAKRSLFSIPRSGAVLSIPSGGSVYEQKSGRYTANIKRVSGNIKRVLSSGMAGRCSILINEN
ncbi:fibronectin type III domain-containing protein [Halobacteriovorax sp. JY17]|uniref:fibronectin type III domain-containing protein n=1 Tax=Halobacteriovorax sp. JY17 TaxID=2014617 RepID=UPI000C5A97F3|nr:fibronectin type III domain-containing protein [Halobacteriovorax sp. JY17]PIK14822.1 MAG: hypothetical protein CES88_10830 [Halobacteriovorax sp. JY17]